MTKYVMNLEEERIAYAVELGKAMTEWADVENSLRYAILGCFSEADHKALSVGFFSIESFRSKLAFAERVIGRKFASPPLSDDWTTLVARLRTASEARNKLVHRPTRLYENGKPGRRLVLVPWIYEKPKIKTRKSMPPRGSLGLMDIIKNRLQFRAIVVSLKNFSERIGGKPERLPKPGEQPNRPPTIPTVVRQIREALAIPPKPS